MGKKYSCFPFGEISLKSGRWYIIIKRTVQSDCVDIKVVGIKFRGKDFKLVSQLVKDLKWSPGVSYEVRNVKRFLNFVKKTQIQEKS